MVLPNIFKHSGKAPEHIKNRILYLRYGAPIEQEEWLLQDLFYYFNEDTDILIVIDTDRLIILIDNPRKDIKDVFFVPEGLDFQAQEEVFMNYVYLLYYGLTSAL